MKKFIEIKKYNVFHSLILNFFQKETLSLIIFALEAKTNDIIFFVAEKVNTVNLSMTSLIKKLGEDLNLINSSWAPCWIVDFPMFERNKEKNLTSLHHPFPLPAVTADELKKAPDNALACAYDFVLNGYDLGGGSLRVYEPSLQY